MIPQCLKIDVESFWNHLESCGCFLDVFFKKYVKNVPKMTPKLVSAQQIPYRWKKMLITIGFLMVWNPCDSEAFVSGALFDAENLGLKTKKTCHRRTPQKCPKGPPEGELKESASHHMNCIHVWTRAPSKRETLLWFSCRCMVFAGSKPENFRFFEKLKIKIFNWI